MLLEELEEHYKLTGDFILLDKSFKSEELDKKCPNIETSIHNLLKSPVTCVVRWVLFKWQLDKSHELILHKLLYHEDEYIQLKTCSILTKFYIDEIPPRIYWEWIKSKLANPTSYDEINQVLAFIADTLASNRHTFTIKNGKIFDRTMVRIEFSQDSTMMRHLRAYLKIYELQYQALRILWLLSFTNHCQPVLVQDRCISVVLAILKDKQREKLVRLSLGIIKNIVAAGFQFSICQAFEIIDLTNVNYTDEDILTNAQFIKDKLLQYVRKSAPIDNYLNELFSGTLEETPYHFNDHFWESNTSTLLEHKVEVLKAFKKYLKSDNPRAICLAANDLHRFIKFCPEVTVLVSKHGLKDDLFRLTDSFDPDVRFHAAQALASTILGDWHE